MNCTKYTNVIQSIEDEYVGGRPCLTHLMHLAKRVGKDALIVPWQYTTHCMDIDNRLTSSTFVWGKALSQNFESHVYIYIFMYIHMHICLVYTYCGTCVTCVEEPLPDIPKANGGLTAC